MEIAARRPNFISDRMAAVIEKAAMEACQRFWEKEKNVCSDENAHQSKGDDHD